MSFAIRVENLGKQYRLGATHDRSVRDAINRVWTSLVGRRPERLPHEQPGQGVESGGEFWALRDVSFEVQPGEVVGIIGRNGSGKSTLLKILSQISAPTTGRVELHGRVASLLEVGTGFHPELSGRENVFLNGAILGMTRPEIHRKFDEIVGFAEIERFIDTPVKRYSSGMYVRLAFAVAAHLEPEILVVDEVLAVGDAEFQKKCMGKMGEVAHGGRTVLFVSHNMAAVKCLCQKVLVLRDGALSSFGPTDGGVASYISLQSAVKSNILTNEENRTGTGSVVFTSFHVEDDRGRILSTVLSGDHISLVFGFRCNKLLCREKVNVGIGIHLITGERLTVLYASHTGQEFEGLPETGEFRCCIPRLPFNPGRFVIFPRIEVNGVEADFPRGGVGFFDVDFGDFYGTGRITYDQSVSPFLIEGSWSVDREPAFYDAGPLPLGGTKR